MFRFIRLEKTSLLHAESPLLTLATPQATMPKQYLPLRGQPIALYSLRTFDALPEVGEVSALNAMFLFSLLFS